jgi:hypothetical protein
MNRFIGYSKVVTTYNYNILKITVTITHKIVFNICLLIAVSRLSAWSHSHSHIATDGQSVSQPVCVSWCRAPWPNISSCLKITVLFMWDTLSEERTGLLFVRVTVSSNKFIASMYSYLYLSSYLMFVYTIYTRPLSVQAQYSRLCPIPSCFRYNGSLVTWTVVCLKSLHGSLYKLPRIYGNSFVTKTCLLKRLLLSNRSYIVDCVTSAMCLPSNEVFWLHSLVLWANSSHCLQSRKWRMQVSPKNLQLK